MFIVPFIHKKMSDNNQFNIHIITILTVGGKELWEEDDSLDIDNDILIPNDIYRKNDIIVDNTLRLCEVDSNKTAVDDFYKWSEININDRDRFCWRSFVILLNKKENWLNVPQTISLSTIKLSSITAKILDSCN